MYTGFRMENPKRTRSRWKDNTKMDLQTTGWEGEE